MRDNIITEEVISYFCKTLSLKISAVRLALNAGEEHYYNIRYYLINTYYWSRISQEIIWDIFLRFIDHKNDEIGNILDFGSGVGLYARKLIVGKGQYLGVDTSKTALEVARLSFRNEEHMKFLFPEEISNIPDNTFDLIFCVEVLNHLDPTTAGETLLSFKRLVKHQGKIFITVTTMQHYLFRILLRYGPRDILSGNLIKLLRRLYLFIQALRDPEIRPILMKDGLEREDHKQTFTLSGIKEVAEKAGLEIIDFSYFTCKDILPGKVFYPINLLLRRVLKISKWYGPNLALLLMPMK